MPLLNTTSSLVYIQKDRIINHHLSCLSHFSSKKHFNAIGYPPYNKKYCCYKNERNQMRDLMTMLNAFDANKCEHGIELVETVQKNSQLSQNSRESIKLFGVEHMSCQPYAARYILKYKPSVVVVETGITPDHCSKTGNEVNCMDMDMSTEGYLMRMCCQMAAGLHTLDDPVNSEFWKEAEKNMNGEYLAYVAAFFTNAKLIYGDRPKDVILRRLDEMTTVTDLDKAFGEQSKLNYKDALENGYMKDRHIDLSMVSNVERIMFLEREAVFCNELVEQWIENENKLVVGIVGAEHVTNIKGLFENDKYKDIMKLIDENILNLNECDKSMMSSPGVKRAILESYLNLSSKPGMISYLKSILEPISDEYINDYYYTLEVYGSTRMLLASLDRELLDQVCCGHRCDMWDVLEDVRLIRPMNGGKGYSFDVIEELRKY